MRETLRCGGTRHSGRLCPGPAWRYARARGPGRQEAASDDSTAHSQGRRRAPGQSAGSPPPQERGEHMRFARPAMKIAILTAVGATAIAACGKSTTTGSTSLGPAGAFGKVPAESTGAQHGGTVTFAAPPSTAPSWILPLITAADNSVYTVFSFDYQLWRPLYWEVNGVSPVEDKALSLANDPVWSNGDKTATITLKSNYKWSDGQPMTSKDILFWYDIMQAAIKQSPANWAAFTPGLGIPDQVASVTAP